MRVATGTTGRPFIRNLKPVPQRSPAFAVASRPCTGLWRNHFLLSTRPWLGDTKAKVAAVEIAQTVIPDVDDPEVQAPKKVFERSFQDQNLEVEVIQFGGEYQVLITSHNSKRKVLHWAVNEWNKPEEVYWPANTVAVDGQAVQTPFENGTTVCINIPEAVCPSALVFVIKELDPENWINGGSGHFSVVLRQPDAEAIANKVINAEATYTNWSLFNRLCMVNEVIDAANLAGPSGMALVFTWLRLSSTRVLPWYKNSNYQSKDVAHVQKIAAQNMAEKARSAEDPMCRLYARMALSGLPRGGGNGDDIRMGILNIMRSYGIKEGHRPGIDERFLEEWHQKLHTNTTPDDIAICEAYLAYQRSNNHDDYWSVLWERGRLTKADLESFSKPLRAWPMHLPHMIPAFEHFLWILKVTHSGADLDTAFTMAQGLLDDDTRWVISDILQNRNEWWVPGKIVEARQRLAGYWKAPGASRDLLLLDIALENWFRTLVERTNLGELSRDSLVDMTALVLRNNAAAVDDEELAQCLRLWEALNGRERWSQEWSLAALAAVQRTELSLAAFMDRMYQQVQPYAERFGRECQLDQKYIMNFGEEVVRGHPAFTLSGLLQNLEPQVRQAAGVSSWQIVSQAPAAGEVRIISSLEEIQGQEFAQPVVLVAEKVGGMEDIPANVQAVLTRSLTDVLSHVAIRARSQKTLLATCVDQGEWGALQQLGGKSVEVQILADGRVVATETAAPKASAGAASNGAATASTKLVLQQVAPQLEGTWSLSEAEFLPEKVGRKSLNLSKLRGKLPDWLSVPASVALPYGTFERVLAANPAVAAKLQALLAPLAEQTTPAEAFATLDSASRLVAGGLVAPQELISDLGKRAAAAGLIPSASVWAPGSKGWRQAWGAICAVWASKWTERAWLSRRARQVPDEDLYMAVLLQQVIPAQYAFVLHTANPISHDSTEMVGELVMGMGETLVGNHPGRALSFTAKVEGQRANVHVSGFPSKRRALLAPAGGTLIARSDANGEDLEDFAGAGLYDSVPFAPLQDVPVDYASEQLLYDQGFRDDLLSRIAQAGLAVKEAFGGQEQDIEGVYSGGKLYIVQARPQVMH